MTTSQHFARQRIVNDHKMRARAIERFEREQRCFICLSLGELLKKIGDFLLRY